MRSVSFPSRVGLGLTRRTRGGRTSPVKVQSLSGHHQFAISRVRLHATPDAVQCENFHLPGADMEPAADFAATAEKAIKSNAAAVFPILSGKVIL